MRLREITAVHADRMNAPRERLTAALETIKKMRLDKPWPAGSADRDVLEEYATAITAELKRRKPAA